MVALNLILLDGLFNEVLYIQIVRKAFIAISFLIFNFKSAIFKAFKDVTTFGFNLIVKHVIK